MELTIADLKPLLPGLEAVLDDEAVSEVMVTEPAAVFVERAGRLAALDAPALTADAVARAAIQIARLLGEDPATDPIIDAQSGRRLARTPLAWQILYRALPESLDTGCVGTLLRRTERATLSDPAPTTGDGARARCRRRLLLDAHLSELAACGLLTTTIHG